MNEYIYFIGALIAGILLGFIFFGGLWFTSRKSLTSKNPAALVLGSFIFRTGILLVGFYFISDGNWKRTLICLLGFIIARILTNRFLSVTKTTLKTENKNEA